MLKWRAEQVLAECVLAVVMVLGGGGFTDGVLCTGSGGVRLNKVCAQSFCGFGIATACLFGLGGDE
jgi:hypothetical protein